MEITSVENRLRLKRLSLRQNFSWTLVGNIVYAGCQWGMLVVLAKMTNTEMVGRFALGLAITAPIIILSQLQLRGIQATDAKNEYDFNDYLSLRLFTTVLALCMIIGVVTFGDYPTETDLIIMAVGFSKAFESISDVCYGLMQQHERMDRIARSQLIKGPLSLAALSSMVYITGNVFWGVIGLSIVFALVLFIYDFKNAATILYEIPIYKNRNLIILKLMLPVFNSRKTIALAKLAYPLGIVMALNSFNTNIPRYFIENIFGESELGVFAALAYLIIVGNMIVTAIGQSVVHRLATHYAVRNIKKYLRIVIFLIVIGLAIGILGVLFSMFAGEAILDILYSEEYKNHVDLFFWIMIAGGLSYVSSFMGYSITATRYFKSQVPILVLTTITTFFVSQWLIPDFGLIGAAFAVIAGTSIKVITSVVVILTVLNIHKK